MESEPIEPDLAGAIESGGELLERIAGGRSVDPAEPKLCRCGCGQVVTGRRAVFASRACSNRRTARILHARAHDDGPRPIAWACGGGVDSTAIAALICRGDLPPPDYAWIVDTGYEPSTTWAYVDQVLTPKLAERGVTLHRLRTVDYVDNALIRGGFVTIPAFRRGAGRPQKLKTRCSQKWKARVSELWLRAQGVEAVEQWIGISAEEMKRIRPTRRGWLRLRYPLVERGMTRADCLHLIGSVGWPMPERSSCYLCPMRSLGDWRRLAARNPDDFAKACAAEKELQKTDPDVFLHPTARPLSVAVNGCRQPPGAADAEGRCAPGTFSCS